MNRGRGDYDGPSRYGGGGDYDGGGGHYGNRDGRGKRPYDDGDSYYGGGNDGGGYKRSRHEQRDGSGGSYYRPRDNNYGNRGGGDRRHGNSGGYDRRQSAPEPENERARTWRLAKKAIVELTEAHEPVRGGSDLCDELLGTASKMRAEMSAEDQEVKRTHLAGLVVRCVGRLSHKTSSYAVLVGLVNEQDAAFGRQVVDETMRQLQLDLDVFHSDRVDETSGEDAEALRKAGDVPAIALRVRLLVRFLGELVSTHVAKAEDVLGVLDALQGVCTPDDFTAESDEPLRTRENAAAYKDFFASVVLDALVHCGQALSVGCEDLYDSLLTRCKEYASNREEESNPRGVESEHPSNWLQRRLHLDLVWEPETDDELFAACKKCDPLSLHWEALQLTRGDMAPTNSSDDMNAFLRWNAPGVLYPQELFRKNFVASEAHAITNSLSIDFNGLDYSKIPRYESLFRVFGEDSGAIGAPLMNLNLAAYLIVRGHMSDAIEAFYPKPAVTAKNLLSLTRSYNARFADAEVSDLKTEYVLLETLLVKALTEQDTARLGYFCSVLTHLVKVDARLISPAFAVVVELLFREIPVMNAGAIDAFVKLFSHFLSNFEFKWLWARWSHVLEASEDDAQRLFVSSVIERCVRLSYLQHMQTALPAEFHALLPPEPKPRIVYGDDGNDESNTSSVAKELFLSACAKLKAHPPVAALQTWLEEEMQSSGIEKDLAIDVVFTAILDAGSATFTHCRLMLEKYGHLGDLFSGEAAELALVKTVGFVWVKSPLHIGLILNMMLRQQIIHATTIAKWIFTSDAVQQYSWPYVWGILEETLVFVQTTIQDAAKKLKDGGNAEAKEGNSEMADVGDLEEQVRRSESELRELLKTIFTGFNQVITEHKSNCDADGISYKDNWFLSALAQMKAMGAKFRVALEDVLDELYIDLFKSNSADHDAKKVFDVVRDSYRN